VWRTLIVTAMFASAPMSLSAQPAPFQDPMLDHMVGKWVLRGTIEGAQTTHDVDVEWVLGHEYLRLHEVSREKAANAQPLYEAIVFVGWDRALGQYACLWLDTTGGGGLSAHAIGHGSRSGNEIAFVFKAADGSAFYTAFAYDADNDTWHWLMDGEEAGKRQPFARLQLTKH
jgi:hypothetical protein